eukprot:tig00001490_g8974.t1
MSIGWQDGIACAAGRAWNLFLGQKIEFKTPRELSAKETVDDLLKIYAGALYGLPGLPRMPVDEAHAEIARRLRTAMYQFGSIFIKVAQYAVQLDQTRREYKEQLADAQAGAESRSSRAYLVAQLACFGEADLRVPALHAARQHGGALECTSASMAAVFKGTWRGRPAAVKLLHESVNRQSYRDDLHIADLLSRYLEGQPEARGVRASIAAVRGRLLGMMDSELDLRLELENQARLRRFAARAGLAIVVPEPLEAHEAGLVSEWMEGPTAKDALEALQAGRPAPEGGPRSSTSSPLPSATSDPHPGNFILMPDGRVALIDYGLYVAYPPEVQKAFADFLAELPMEEGALEADPGRAAALLRRVGTRAARERAPAAARHLFFGEGDGIFPDVEDFEQAFVPALVIVMYLANFERAAASARAARGLPDRARPSAVAEAFRAASTARFAPLRALR